MRAPPRSRHSSRGEVNVVEILEGPQVELVNVANRVGQARDTVTVRITARLRDYVRTGSGTEHRVDHSTRPVEYWSLREDAAGTWIVASVEQAGEGEHHLTDAIETDGWDQREVAREAVLEVATRTAAEGSGDPLSLTGISWSTQADAAAADLSVIDTRFGKQILEIAIERFIEEWVINDGSLDVTAHRTSNRTVMRTAVIDSIEVDSLLSRAPIVFRVAVASHGVYYEVDRGTEEVLRGDPRTRRPLAFAFDLRLSESPEQGWSVIDADAQYAAV